MEAQYPDETSLKEQEVNAAIEAARQSGEHDIRIAKANGMFFPVCDTHHFSVLDGISTEYLAKVRLVRHFKDTPHIFTKRTLNE